MADADSMTQTSKFISGINRMLGISTAAQLVDTANTLGLRSESPSEVRSVLDEACALAAKQGISPVTATVSVAGAGQDERPILHHVRMRYRDIELVPEMIGCHRLCEEHEADYRRLLEEQNSEFETSDWERLTLLCDLSSCSSCQARIGWQLVYDKEALSVQLTDRIVHDVPEAATDLSRVKVLVWGDLTSFFAWVHQDPLGVQGMLSRQSRPCIMACWANASGEGSDYLRFVSLQALGDRHTIAGLLREMAGAPFLSGVVEDRLRHVDADLIGTGYLPPEYWVTADLLRTPWEGRQLPRWFMEVAELFALSLLWTISTRVEMSGDTIGFCIERRYSLELKCRIVGRALVVLTATGPEVFALESGLLVGLLSFYASSMHNKYDSVSVSLVREALAYGSGFAFDGLLRDAGRVKQYYEFEHLSLLNERFAEQSRSLQELLDRLTRMRERLTTLIDSLSGDLSQFVLAVLAASVSAVVGYVLDSTNGTYSPWVAMVILAMLGYVYVPSFLFRVLGLMNAGRRAVREFRRDLSTSERIWGYPLQSICLDQHDTEYHHLIRPLAGSFSIVETVAIAAGLLAHAVFVAIAISQDSVETVQVKLALDIAVVAVLIRLHTDHRSVWQRYSSRAVLVTFAVLVLVRVVI